MAENIASTIATVRNNENTKRLLEETQQYALQTKEQEDKAIQSMQELAITKEQMERNQQKLDEYRKNLEQEVENRTTEIREKEIKLSEVISQLQGIIDSAKSGIVAIDTQYKVVAANQLSREQVRKRYQTKFKTNDNWLNIYANEQERLTNKLRWDKTLGGNHFVEEEKVINAEGEAIWYELAFNPITDDNKAVIGASMFARDITERKHEAQNMELTAYVIDNATSEVYIFDAQTFLFTQVNARACQNLGYTSSELKTLTPYQIAVGLDQVLFKEILKPLETKEKNDLEIELTLQRKDGTRYEAFLDIQLFSDQEKPIYAIIAHDITERKREEVQVQEALNRFHLATQATKEGFWEMSISINDPINPDNEVWWSPRFKELLGLTESDSFPEKLVSWSARLHPDDRAHTLRALYEHLTDRKGGKEYEVEYRLLTLQNEYEWFYATGETLRDEQGNPVKVAGSIRNINRRKKTESELVEKNSIVNSILNATINSISAITSEQNILMTNPATQRIFGFSPQELKGTSIRSLLADETEDLSKYVNTTRNVVGKNKQGDTIDLEVTVTAGMAGEKTIYVVVFRENKK